MANKAGANSNNKSSGIRGVTWNKKDRRWQAQMMKDRRFVFVGQFASKAAAARAARSARRELFGLFAGA